jgi:uncharacterized membrane protein HdeD (DUF308 family)
MSTPQPAAEPERLSNSATDRLGYVPGSPFALLKVHRGELIAVAVIGVILGIIGLVFPGPTLLTVAILFGVYLILSGVFRITTALVADRLSVGLRWLTGTMGLLVLIAGIFCLSNPFRSLAVLAFVIGVGWIAEGIILAIAAGISMFWLPLAGLAVLVTVGAILLLIVSGTTLLTLPRRSGTSAS